MDNIINTIENFGFSAFEVFEPKSFNLYLDSNKKYSQKEYQAIASALRDVRPLIEEAVYNYNYEMPSKVKYTIDALALLVGVDELAKQDELFGALELSLYSVAAEIILDSESLCQHGEIIHELVGNIELAEYGEHEEYLENGEYGEEYL